MPEIIKKKTGVLNYVLKIWITSVILSPVVVCILAFGQPRYFLVDLPVFFILSIFWGALFSLPGFFILYLLAKQIHKQQWSIILKKGVLAIAGVILVVVPFYIMDGDLHGITANRKLVISYLILVVTGIIVFRLEKKLSQTF